MEKAWPTYNVNLRCENCKNVQSFNIPEWEMIQKYLNDMPYWDTRAKCIKCKCYWFLETDVVYAQN